VLLAHDLPVIVAGDFNLHPTHVVELFDVIPMKDVIAIDGSRKERADGIGGTRVWTHKNTDDPNKNASVQELDFIFATEDIWDDLINVRAGVEDFPDAWTMSDHAPVVAEFRIQK
jgi:endonuclease/exonuclease/phosphatase family metal-dependent hydrolase